MNSFINSISISTYCSALNNRNKKKYLHWLFSLAFLIAFLEFSQDYISSVLNENYFSLIQSLSYKLFWFVSIPLSFLLMYWFDKAKPYFSNGLYFASSVFIISLITLAHLLIFSLLLHIISYLAYTEPWSLNYLLTEKLSTRLYIGFSFYIIFSVIYSRLERRDEANLQKEKSPLKKILVKNGQKTTLVDVNKISWIRSDGPYLMINTAEKEHVILDRLKNIIIDLPDNFKRIHKSTIVNIDYIKNLKSRGNGDYDVVMKGGDILRLSRNYTKPLRGFLL